MEQKLNSNFNLSPCNANILFVCFFFYNAKFQVSQVIFFIRPGSWSNLTDIEIIVGQNGTSAGIPIFLSLLSSFFSLSFFNLPFFILNFFSLPFSFLYLSYSFFFSLFLSFFIIILLSFSFLFFFIVLSFFFLHFFILPFFFLSLIFLSFSF